MFDLMKESKAIREYCSYLNDTLVAQIEQRAEFSHQKRKVAYITYITPGYELGAITLARTLNKWSKIPLICLYSGAIDKEIFTDIPLTLICVPIINHSKFKRTLVYNEKVSFGFFKLWVFGLSCFERVVYLDSDMTIEKSIDDLFEKQGFWAVADGAQVKQGRIFNAGLMVFTPTQDLFDDIIGRAPELDSYDSADQGFLNSYFQKWQELDFSYNIFSYEYLKRKDEIGDKIKVIHYAGKKPWSPFIRKTWEPSLKPLEKSWMMLLTTSEKLWLLNNIYKEGYKVGYLYWSRYQKIRKRYRRRIYIGVAIGFLLGLIIGGAFF